jgi:hypothetical protein
MLRRRIVAAVVLVPLGIAGVIYGCGSGEPPIEDLCGWLSNPQNCYRQFAEDVGTQCIAPDGGNVGSFGPAVPGMPTMLATCVLNGGGAVTFNPPLDPTTFPLGTTNLGAGGGGGGGPTPTMVAFSLTDEFGNECVAGTFSNSYSFSITYDGQPDGGTPVCPENDAGAPLSTDPANCAPFNGGTYSEVTQPGRNTLDTTCPVADTYPLDANPDVSDAAAPEETTTHHFDSLFVTDCPYYSAILPQAILTTNAGAPAPPDGTTPGVAGSVSFAVYYPPGAKANGEYPSPPDYSPTASPGIEPTTVTYFTCTVPAALPLCEDGIRDGEETDIDCGGPICPKCMDGQDCLSYTDCQGRDCFSQMGVCQCGVPTPACPPTPDIRCGACVQTGAACGGTNPPCCTGDCTSSVCTAATTTTTTTTTAATTGAGGAGGMGGAGGA